MELLKEFKPALTFVGKFLGLYLVGNLIYGVYVESYKDAPDGITHAVAAQTSWVLNVTGYDTHYAPVQGAPKVAITTGARDVLRVFEGCNGVNVMIVFVAFLFAFGGRARALAVFIVGGILVIHLFNLLRIGLLFHLALHDSPRFYYYHKYFFTAILYFVVFALWALWVMKFNEKRKTTATA